MSDESRAPEPGPAEAPDPASAPETASAPEPSRYAPGGPGATGDPEPTGIIDLHDTRAIPSPASSSVVPPASSPAGTAEGTSTGQEGQHHSDDAWFDVFGGDRASRAAGVPPRADEPWNDDRPDGIPAGPSPYAPPVAGTRPDPGADGGGAEGAAAGVLLADPAPPTRRRGRGRLVAAVAGLCLLSGVVGGVAGQLAQDRINLAGSTLPDPGPGATQRPAGSVANIAAVALPSVVTIKVDAGSEGSATGSGFVVDAKGHILTNNHVVQASVNGDIEVVLSNGDTEKATVVGRDASYDLAVLRIKRTDLKPLQLGRSDKVVVGDQVIAVGAPLGLDQTVTTGIVSALNRPVTPGEGTEASYINAIQTDAAINPGNSGGPLLDMTGKVIGVNSAIARVPGTSGSTGGSIGLGFAIPSDQARRTADQLIATGKATHPVIGVQLSRTFTGEGAEVADTAGAVTAEGPAAKAGVRPGDVIVGFEGKRIRTPDQLVVSIRARGVGDTVTLKVRRGQAELELRMTLEADPGS
ncbi:trypsin-like peptidase domain-containing protein [Terrabacter sp. BE26]|uniref:S1C family serine protease n=1 Tax=Terrabacter sp. BE26 TaxID=2898152 RepID=UPI0035BE1DF3